MTPKGIIFGKMSEMSHKINKCPLCGSAARQRFLGYKLNERQGFFPPRNYKEAEKVFGCKVCDLKYVFPPVQLSENFFSEDDSLRKQMNNALSQKEDSLVYSDILVFIRENTDLMPGAKILDVGSGLGMVSYCLRKQGFEVWSVEPDHELYHFAKRENMTDATKSFNSRFEDCHFPEELFDFIFLEPLHHFTFPHEAIQKTLHWLKPGGYLHLEVANHQWLYKKIIQFIYKCTFRKHVVYTSPKRKPFIVAEYSDKTFRYYERAHNLQVCFLLSDPCDTGVKNRWLNAALSWFMRRFGLGMETSVILRK